MFKIGCHLSTSKGYAHMAQEALSIGANVFQEPRLRLFWFARRCSIRDCCWVFRQSEIGWNSGMQWNRSAHWKVGSLQKH